MLPNNNLTNPVIFNVYIPPDDIPVGDLEDWELGGIGLSDPSAGLQYQNWHAFVTGSASTTQVWVESDNTAPTLMFAYPNITWVRLAFDQNMHPVIAFVGQDGSMFWWFDPTVPEQVFFTLPTGSGRASCTMDDKRDFMTSLGLNDVIISYVRNDSLVYRQERDRYAVEYILLPNVSTLISNPYVGRVGMNEGQRLQFEIRGALYQ